ncbi:hypothetical protein M569_12215, partial [Genlisea aurea]
DCNCGTRCCSQWGYCGDTEHYCGLGCRNGSCWKDPPQPPSAQLSASSSIAPEISDSSIVTPEFFDSISARR